nr:hypothetical protein [Nitrosomonas nitrosa]
MPRAMISTGMERPEDPEPGGSARSSPPTLSGFVTESNWTTFSVQTGVVGFVANFALRGSFRRDVRLAGGVRSQDRTLLRANFPDKQGICREFSPKPSAEQPTARSTLLKSHRFSANSLLSEQGILGAQQGILPAEQG